MNRGLMRTCALLLALFGAAPAARAQEGARNGAQNGAPAGDRSLTIGRVSRPPELADFMGGGAVRVDDFRQREPGDGVPASRPTAAYVAYDDANLYVTFVCRDDPARIRARVARREEIDGDDAVAIYLDTFHDRERAYVFMANPLGVQLDGIITEGQDDDLRFDAVWHAEGRVTENGYMVRMVIPFRSLRFPNASAQRWGIALSRITPRDGEESYWPAVTKRVQGLVPQFATLHGLADISPARNVQVNPYTTLARARFLDDDAATFRTDGDQRLGVDAKAVVRDALTLDATVNPDFSQVETDDPQVTINERFDVFFPEKRPFFIENAGYFQTPVNLLYSRRIVDPGAGLRLTGKVGRWAVGAIAIDDREPGRAPAPDPLAGSRAGAGAFRVQRELGEESTVGALITDRELEDGFDRVFAVDGRLRLGSNWAVAAQLMRSETRDLNGDRRGGGGAFAKVEREGRHFDYTGRYVHFDPDFSAPLGFVRRTGIRETEHQWKYRWRPEGKAVLNYGPSAFVLYDWDPAGALLDREVGAEFQVELVGETEIQVEHARAFERFDDLPFHPYGTEVSVSTEWLKWLGLEASYTWGKAVNHDPAAGLDPFLGPAREAEVQLTVRPTPRLRMDQAYASSRLGTATGARVLAERLWRTKVQYQFNRSLSLRAIADYEAESGDPTLAEVEGEHAWRWDVLFTYLVTPGTAIYAGFTDRLENLDVAPGPPPSVFRTGRRTTSVGRQVFVKLNYLFRF